MAQLAPIMQKNDPKCFWFRPLEILLEEQLEEKKQENIHLWIEHNPLIKTYARKCGHHYVVLFGGGIK